jgi:hypothetical protein
MRGVKRSWHDSSDANTTTVADPLKGLLRDKGVLDAERHIRIIQRKILCVQEAMARLVDDQRASTKAVGCDCMDLYLATDHRVNNIRVDHRGREALSELVIEELKSSCVLEWRAKNSFASRHQLSRTGRLQPFDKSHPTHALVYAHVSQMSPGYYTILAAYETARLTLNHALKALRKMAMDLHRVRVEAEGLPIELFTKDTAKLSRQFIASMDKAGELTWILQGLYFEI